MADCKEDTTTVNVAEPLTLARAAEIIRWKGSRRAAAARLERYLRQREKVANDWIIADVGTGVYAKPRVTLARMREFCPELFDTRVQLTELVREAVAEFDDRMCKIERNEDVLAHAIERLAAGRAAGDDDE